jgi:hypothetical protein
METREKRLKEIFTSLPVVGAAGRKIIRGDARCGPYPYRPQTRKYPQNWGESNTADILCLFWEKSAGVRLFTPPPRPAARRIS